MTNYEIKIGYFVKYIDALYSIKHIDNDMVTLSDNLKVKINEVELIEIGDPLDFQITLVNDLLRYSIISGKNPIESFRYYQDCFISNDKTIRDVLKENSAIKYVFQLQEWLASNTNGFRLQSWIGKILTETNH